MKDASLIDLFDSLLQDCGRKCSTVMYGRDLVKAKSRIKHEGLSFLTITLPDFADEFFYSLEQSQVDSNSFVGWQKNQYLPAFLQGFTSLVFDYRTGRRLDEPNIQAIRSIRQIGYFFKKINLPCSKERVAKALLSYEAIEDDLSKHVYNESNLDIFSRVSAIVTSTLFPGIPAKEDFIPHHGPGSTQEKLTGNGKYRFSEYTWFSQLEVNFPVGYNLYSSEEIYFQEKKKIEVTEELPFVRVEHVPKTLKTPRIIAMEPVAMQFAQQSVKDYIVRTIEQNPLTKGHINFQDQTVNKRLALENSKTQYLATLDLSAASDRVLNDLVKMMLRVNPFISEYVQNTRSPIARLGSKNILLNKFASMGSALCFPIEALIFFNICISSRIAKKHILPSDITLKLIQKLSRDIYVYGDDILSPSAEVEFSVPFIESFGLKVSTSKSFFKGKFRESCGMDAYDGEDVTPIYLRQPIPRKQSEAKAIVSFVATGNLLAKSGYYITALRIVKLVEQALGFRLPSVVETCAGLGWVDPSISDSEKNRIRWNHNLQRFEVLTVVPSISFKKDKIDGIPALAKCLHRLNYGSFRVDYPVDLTECLYLNALSSDEKHLDRTPRRGSLTLKTRWVAFDISDA